MPSLVRHSHFCCYIRINFQKSSLKSLQASSNHETGQCSAKLQRDCVVPAPVSANLTPDQLRSIKGQLDLVLLALETLVGIGSEAILDQAKSLQVASLLSDRVSLWRLRQSSPLRKGQGRKKLDVDEARALVLITAQLAGQHRQAINQAVTALEQAAAADKPPHRVAVLGDYLDRFSNTYSDRMEQEAPPTVLEKLAFQLLIDLLFYSSGGGAQRLWQTLLDRAE
ncbi:DUF3038 domain-containing protein [Leptolyngbya cf. ectocarpi LEGE 11479]|uniref:DUF3038 domain-containing protein n=1 Tax=Leptolyngbya cf. ectocarpi LEGE 11479 TaxID=1828722 RepID=A0A929F817_LEPEC|nr:DUF3038 domain-containing protein [Leptolyngbya cf. ectocarpi LEGE 11479]